MAMHVVRVLVTDDEEEQNPEKHDAHTFSLERKLHYWSKAAAPSSRPATQTCQNLYMSGSVNPMNE
jgi:hypothetical protein